MPVSIGLRWLPVELSAPSPPLPLLICSYGIILLCHHSHSYERHSIAARVDGIHLILFKAPKSRLREAPHKDTACSNGILPNSFSMKNKHKVNIHIFMLKKAYPKYFVWIKFWDKVENLSQDKSVLGNFFSFQDVFNWRKCIWRHDRMTLCLSHLIYHVQD